MEHGFSSLLDWTEAYVKHRDLFERKIADVEKKEKELILTNKDGTVSYCLVFDSLDDAVVGELDDEKRLITTRNTKENVDFLLTHWSEFAKHKSLKIVFVNLKHDEKWVLIPSSHHAIADLESLERGIRAMHQSVPEG